VWVIAVYPLIVFIVLPVLVIVFVGVLESAVDGPEDLGTRRG
jgi:hypothetical protein